MLFFRHKVLFYVFIFFISVIDIYAEIHENDSTTLYSILKEDVHSTFYDISSIYTSSSIETINDLKKPGLLVAGSLLGMTCDNTFKSIAERNKVEVDGKTIEFVNNYGNLYYQLGISGSIYAIGLISDSKKLRNTARLTVESFIVSGLITTVLKSIIGRARPYAKEGNQSYHWFQTNDAYLSFPSGHSTIAFAASTVFANQLDTWWGDVLFYGLASGTAYARMHKDAHWFSDILLGGGIGYLSAKAILHAHNEHQNNVQSNHFIPILSPTAIGIAYQF
jgi:hypothetical protein